MKIINETRVGIFAVLVIILLGILTWRAGDIQIRRGGYEIKVHFKNIDGVALNAPVTVNGLEVGRVSDIQILYGKQTVMELALWLREGVQLREGAEAFVKNLGFLGEKYVALTTGDDALPFLKKGAVIQGNEPPSFERLLSQGDAIAGNLEEISAQLKERLQVNAESMDNIVANLDTALTDIASITSKINQTLDSNQGSIDQIIANVNNTTHNLEEMSFDLKENPWKLLYRGSRKK